MTASIRNWALGFRAFQGLPGLAFRDAEPPFDTLIAAEGGQRIYRVGVIACSSALPDRSAYSAIKAAAGQQPSVNDYVALVFPTREIAVSVASGAPLESEFNGYEVEVMVGYIEDEGAGAVFRDLEHRLYYV